MRCLLRETGRTAEDYAVGGWRQWRHLSREVKKLFNKVRSTRRAQRHPERVEAYVERCRALVERAEATLDALRDQGVEDLGCRSITGLVAHARRQIDQVERRLLRGETIPHEEKVFSIFEEHTRWVSKGKAGTPVELGVPIALIEDQYQFILHHKVLWAGEDVDVAVPMVQEAQELYPELRACSFDRGFHSPANRVRLDALLDLGEHAATAFHMTPTEVEMEARTDVANGLRDVRSDAALVGELAVPIDDRPTARLHQEALGEVHPDVRAGEAAEHEIGAIDRRAIHVPVGTLRTCRQAQDERVDADAVDGRNRGPDDAAEASSRRGQCGRIDLLGTRLRKSSRDSDQQHDGGLPTPEQKENHGFDNGRRVPSIVSRRSDHVRGGQSRQ